MLPEFEKKYGIDVEFESVGWGQPRTDKLLVAFAGGVGPDLVILGSNYHYTEKDFLIPLDQYIERWPDKDKILPQLWNTKRIDGKIWCIPHHGEIRAMAYNSKIFQENGIPDRPIASWEEWLNYTKKLTRIEGGRVVQAGFEWNYALEDFRWLALMAGSDLGDWTNHVSYVAKEPVVKALQFIRDLRQVTPPGIGRLGYTAFYTGKVAITWGIAVVLRQTYLVGGEDLGAQVRIYPPRYSADRDPVTLAFINGFGITKTAKDPDAAWKLIEFMMSRESMISLLNADFDYMLLRTDIVSSQARNPKMRVYLPFYDMMEASAEGLPGPWTSPFRTELGAVVTRALNDQITVSQAVENMNTIVNTFFTDMQKQ